MGRRLEDWLSKALSENTRNMWKSNWMRFAKWATSTTNPLTDKPFFECSPLEVDDVIRSDFETLPNHLFLDKYRGVLDSYIASLKNVPSNSLNSYVSSVRSFLIFEAVNIELPRGRLPAIEMASGEHRFTHEEFKAMWRISDIEPESRARLSVALCLGWSAGDFLALERRFVETLISRVDADGFASFDYKRRKTNARVRGIIGPAAISDLENYLKRIPEDQEKLWTVTTVEGLNFWLRALTEKAKLKPNGQVRFHLIRKYVMDTVAAKCGLNEAKLLVGKTIPLSDAIYLHGLEDRLLERYKKFAYPLIRLDEGEQPPVQSDRVRELEEEVRLLKEQHAKFVDAVNVGLSRIEARISVQEKRLGITKE